MAINSVRNRRNRGGMSAETSPQTLKFITNQLITPVTPIIGRRGKPFTDSVTNEEYYNYYLAPNSDPLPAGLTLNGRTGEITGTPTAVTLIDELHFSVTIRIAVKDSIDHVAYKKSALTIVIVDPFVVQEKTLTYDGKVNKLNISDSLFTSVTGGRPPYVYTITQGTLPPGVSIDQVTGTISGLPTDTKRTFTSLSQVEELIVEDPITVTVTDFYETVVTNITTVNFNIEDVIIAVPNPNVKIKGVVPLTVSFTGFSSVTLGTEPYSYFTPAAQQNSMPLGVTLNSETGVISGVYTGNVTNTVDGVEVTTHEEYTGTLQVAVQDQDGNIASKISKIDIQAYLPLATAANHKNEQGSDILTFTWVATKPVNHTPLKALYGDKPYTFQLWFCSYIDKQNNLTQYETTIPGVEINSSTGAIIAANGLLAGTYLIDLKVLDSSGTVHESALRIMYLVEDAIIATVLTNNTSYQLYVNNQSSNLAIGYTVLRAELGIPPYTFKVSPELPSGLTFNTTTNTCSIIGTPDKAGQTICEFSVKDSTGMQAVVKHTISFNVADELVTSADVIEIVKVLGEPTGKVDIFKTIKGGFPPYECTLMFGKLPPEYTFRGANFSYFPVGSQTATVVAKPKLWGNDWVDVPGGVSPTPNATFNHLGSYTSYYTISDSMGAVSANRASVKFTILKPISATANDVPTITGKAGITKVSFKPITVTGGIPPYTIHIATSALNPDTNEEEQTPTLSLKTGQPDTIFGTPNRGYTGKMYFYITDSRNSSTPSFPVNVDILAAFTGVTPMTIPSVMCVQGFPLFEVIHTKNDVVVTEKVVELNEPLFLSVTGGNIPYTYYESDDNRNVAIPSKQTPPGFWINPNTGILSGNVFRTIPIPKTPFKCAVADKDNIKTGPSPFFLTINQPLTTEKYDNVTYSSFFTSADGVKYPDKVTKVVGDDVSDFKVSIGKYGSGRYSYQLVFLYGESGFYSNFVFSSRSGSISAADSSLKLMAPMSAKISVKVTDTFTGMFLYSYDYIEITVYPKLSLSINPACIPQLTLLTGKIITYDNFAPILISGGSGYYVITSVPPLPSGLSIDNTGLLVDAPSRMATIAAYTIHVDDAIFPGVTANKTFNMIVATVTVVIDIPQSVQKKLDIQFLMEKSNLTYVDVQNTPIDITINVLGTISSATPLVPALFIDWGVIHPMTTVLIDIKGGYGIVGAGGAAGTYSASTPKIRDGKPGGPGLKLNLGQAQCTIRGNGRIVGGGGGGGGAGGDDWIQIAMMKASRYLISETTTFNTSPYKVTGYDAPTVDDGTKVPVGNGIWMSPPIVIDKINKTGTNTYLYAMARDPSPLSTAKDQAPGKAKPAVVMTGSAGGRGAGDSGGATPGQQGVKSVKGPGQPSKPVEPSMPSDAAFNKANANPPVAGITPPVKRAMPVITLDFAGSLSCGDRSGANDGSGILPGLAGLDTFSYEGILYGCAGGGGGGFGGVGGDGGTSSKPPGLTAKLVRGGFGGQPGLAIDASDCFLNPIITPSTIVAGEIQLFVDDPVVPTP